MFNSGAMRWQAAHFKGMRGCGMVSCQKVSGRLTKDLHFANVF